jgi:pimeloyl-ACP methyl ester carboxylesterase
MTERAVEDDQTVSENVHFTNRETSLAGTLYLPRRASKVPAIVAVHAARGGLRAYPFYVHLTRALPEAGIAVLLFDRRGSGESGGDFETADFQLLAEDARSAGDYLASRKEIDPDKVGYFGVSQGGWIAPLAAANHPQAACLVIVSGCGVSPAEQMTYSACTALSEAGYPEEVLLQATALRRGVDDYFRGERTRQEVQAELDRFRPQPWFELAFLPEADELPEDMRTSKWYYEFDYDPLPAWEQVQQPTLFLYGEQDRWVPIDESVRRYVSATAHLDDVTFVQIPGADHLMTDLKAPVGADVSGEVSPGYVAVLVDWLRERLVDAQMTG